jgi:hypothetical protein
VVKAAEPEPDNFCLAPTLGMNEHFPPLHDVKLKGWETCTFCLYMKPFNNYVISSNLCSGSTFKAITYTLKLSG